MSDDEISLIDLLVVFLKRRRLITWVGLITIMISSLVFFVLPRFGIVSFSTFTIQATAVAVQLPPALDEQLGMDLALVNSSYAQNKEAVSAAVIRNGISKKWGNNPSNLEFRTFISRSFIGRKYRVTDKEGVITFELVVKDPEAGKQFLVEMIQFANARTNIDIANRCDVIAKSMESLYSKTSGSESILSETARQLIISSETYRTKNMPTLILSSEPEILINAQGRTRNVVVTVMAGLFFAIILAFILDYIDRLKADPTSMEKIIEALGKKRP